MLLAIDIGNSTTKFGVFDGAKLTEKITIKTNRNDRASSIYSQINEQISVSISAIVISTVVNELKDTYRDLGKTHFKLPALFADHSFDYGFKIQYFPPKDCGSDRLVDAFAAVEKYGNPVIVCDFGTATTIDLVDENKKYLGGIITPGPNTLGSALFEKTSKLPDVEFEKPEKAIGDSTVSSIQSGIYYGYIGLVDGIIARFINETRVTPKIVSTGGFARLIAEESKYVEIVEPDLMLEGLRLVYEKWESEKTL